MEYTLDSVKTLRDPLDRVRALLGILPGTPEAYRDTVSAHAEEAAGRIPDPQDRCEILLRLLQYVSAAARGRIVARIIHAMQRVEQVNARVRILNDLADFKMPDVLASALPGEAEWAGRLPFEARRFFGALIPYLSSTAVESVLQSARMIHDERAQVEALTGLAAYLSATRRDAVIALAVALEEDEALEREDRYRRIRVVARLARRLAAEGHADEAIDVAEALPHSDNVWPSTRFDALTQVAVTLAASDPRAALRAVARISRGSDHGKALAAVLSQVPERQQHEVLTLARAMGENVPTSLLTDLKRRQAQDRSTTPAGGHPNSDRERTSSRTGAARSIAAARQAAGRRRAELIIEVAEWLDTDLARRALELAEDIDDSYTEGKAVAAVAARLVTLGQPKEATAAILRLPHIYLRGDDTNPRVDALAGSKEAFPAAAGRAVLADQRAER